MKTLQYSDIKVKFVEYSLEYNNIAFLVAFIETEKGIYNIEIEKDCFDGSTNFVRQQYSGFIKEEPTHEIAVTALYDFLMFS